ncbi:hypothetical protein EB151_11470 [archaeon]|nr:hypothetical protein [archaeon]
MKKFRHFILEEAMIFSKMSRNEWEKVKARSNDLRTDILKDAIKAGDPVSDINGNDLNIANSSDNMSAIDDFLKGDAAFFELKLTNGKKIKSNEIGKSPLFGGMGKGAGMTGQTAEAESLQCIYLAAIIGEGSKNAFSHFTFDKLSEYKNKVDVDVDFDKYMALDSSWHESAYVTAQALIKNKYVGKNHVFHRGSKTMNAIYAKKTQALKNQGMPPMQNDKWNPGDIWAVKKGVDVNRVIDSTTIASCNASILKNFLSTDIVGISLKKIKGLDKKSKVSEYNVEETILDTHTFKSITLETAKGKGIFSSKYGFLYFDRDGKMDIRAPNLFSAINFEIQGKGARGGRTGYTQIMYSSKTHLKKTLPSNIELKTEANELAKSNRSKVKVNNFWKMVKKIHPSMNEGQFLEGLESKQGQGHFIHAILGAAYIAYAILTSTKAQQNAFVSEIVNVAGAKTNDSSAYVKVEEG